MAEGIARESKKEGGSWALRFCIIFETENGQSERRTAFGAVAYGFHTVALGPIQ